MVEGSHNGILIYSIPFTDPTGNTTCSIVSGTNTLFGAGPFFTIQSNNTHCLVTGASDFDYDDPNNLGSLIVNDLIKPVARFVMLINAQDTTANPANTTLIVDFQNDKQCSFA